MYSSNFLENGGTYKGGILSTLLASKVGDKFALQKQAVFRLEEKSGICLTRLASFLKLLNIYVVTCMQVRILMIW